MGLQVSITVEMAISQQLFHPDPLVRRAFPEVKAFGNLFATTPAGSQRQTSSAAIFYETSEITRAPGGWPYATPTRSAPCLRFLSAAGSSLAPGGYSPSWRPAPPDRPRVLAIPPP